ncbi:MAG TPA: hypothetical protein VGS96_09115, partial [Thermoanaerobaculia bacterium]|nr:hypothetical protein [Thermoanaerobaculia bacterium]
MSEVAAVLAEDEQTPSSPNRSDKFDLLNLSWNPARCLSAKSFVLYVFKNSWHPVIFVHGTVYEPRQCRRFVAIRHDTRKDW